jgi:hypothetical protein
LAKNITIGSDITILILPYVLEKPFRGQFRNTEIAGASFGGAVSALLEVNDIPFTIVDSGKWQKIYLGSKIPKGETKIMSKTKGIQRWPLVAPEIEDHGDADPLFLAALAMREFA